MFARYLGVSDIGLQPNAIYYIGIIESLVDEKRTLSITVGDYWANDYSSFSEAMAEWAFEPYLDIKQYQKIYE